MIKVCTPGWIILWIRSNFHLLNILTTMILYVLGIQWFGFIQILFYYLFTFLKGQQWGNSYVPIADLVVPPFPDLINEHPDMMNENYSNNYREGELLPYPSIASCTPTEIFNLEQPHYHPTTHMDKPFDPIFLRNTLPLHQTSPIHSSENQTKLRFVFFSNFIYIAIKSLTME